MDSQLVLIHPSRLGGGVSTLEPGTSRHAGFDMVDMLDAHNRWRAEVGVPPLVYSPALANAAQGWASHLRDRNQCRMEHSRTRATGENLFWASARRWTNGVKELQAFDATTVVDAWASERADFDESSNRCAPGARCGHYTQVVWKETKAVGCAVAVCEDSREQVWVCEYQPPGNWVGKRPF